MGNFLLVTRFNVPQENGSSVSEGWMKRRVKLFRKVCVPSVQSQSNKEFDWLVFLDNKTDGSFVKEIERVGRCELVFVRDMSEFIEEVKRRAKIKAMNYGSVITSRLDNDDSINSKYVSNVKSKIGKNNEMVRCKKGLQILIEGGEPKKVRRVFQPRSPFISLKGRVGDTGSVKTVYDSHHARWSGGVDIKEIDEEDMWIQFVHGDNKANGFANGSPVRRVNVKNKFGVDMYYESNTLDYWCHWINQIKNRLKN